MTREEAKELLPIIQAFVEGKTIEYREHNGGWKEALAPTWSSLLFYRIKPEPKYRPFKTKEECWQEMLKHQPFGWIMDESKYVEIVNVYENEIEFSPEADYDGDLLRRFMTFESVPKHGYTFVDGAPFGIKEE